MVLYQHDRDFTITINGEDLMLSRHHESELELARLGCAHLAGRKAPSILIGGLGMGYTLRQALWNRQHLGVLNGQPLADQRVDLKIIDIVELISGSKSRFDAILLDVDNGPSAMSDAGNSRLYGYEGISACRGALRKKGCLAVWSVVPSKEFEQLLMDCGFDSRRYRVPAYKGSKSQSRFVWVASEDRSILPPGGGEPRQPGKKRSKKSRRRK
jgi:spermidine synthase